MFHMDDQGRLIRRWAGETLCVEAWGENGLHVRAVQNDEALEGQPGALLDKVATQVQITLNGDTAAIVNGKIRGEITSRL